jgi:LCP family protein required for cell wall assembly
VAGKEKPYRVYRGGRAKGPIKPLGEEQRDERDGRGEAKPRRARARRPWLKITLVTVAALIVFALVWTALGYLAVRSGVKAANKRLPARAKSALAPAKGSVLTTPTTILVLGSDRGPGKGRSGVNRSDAIQLIRTDPDHHKIAYLFIPRDLRVDIPGHGSGKINAAYAYGGPALTVRTVEHLTGLPVNHVAVVDFRSFADVIDALGGVTVDVHERIRSKFDCPYKAARCAHWRGWIFHRGEQTLNGQRALVYARVRKNLDNPGDTDISRGTHQQQVMQAVADKIVGFGSWLRMPFIGDNLVKPLATDLSTGQLLELGWVKFRTPNDGSLRCRLGGTPNGDGSIQATEENVSVIAMVTGESAPQPPPPDNRLFGPGCFVGRAK